MYIYKCVNFMHSWTTDVIVNVSLCILHEFLYTNVMNIIATMLSRWVQGKWSFSWELYYWIYGYQSKWSI